MSKLYELLAQYGDLESMGCDDIIQVAENEYVQAAFCEKQAVLEYLEKSGDLGAYNEFLKLNVSEEFYVICGVFLSHTNAYYIDMCETLEEASARILEVEKTRGTYEEDNDYDYDFDSEGDEYSLTSEELANAIWI